MQFPFRITEESAARAVERGGLSRVAVGVSSTVGLAMDPNDTLQVFTLTLALDRYTLPRLRDRMSETSEGRRLLADRLSIDTRSVDYDALRQLPERTLGGAYVRMLDREHLDPDVFHAPPGIPADLAYVVQRVRQTHDIWHVLTGLSTSVPGEIALQAFSYAQLGQRTSFLIATVGTGIHGRTYSGTVGLARRAYRDGKKANFLLDTVWEDHWSVPINELRVRFHLPLLD